MQDSQVTDTFEESLFRMVGDGVHYPIVDQLKRSIARWEQWFDAWAAVARSYEARGDAAEQRGLTTSAGEDLWQASICWQYAQFLWFHDPERRLEGQRRKVEAYRRAAPYLLPPAQRVNVPFGNMSIPGYLRMPSGDVPPHPCVLLLGGLESTKEESYHFENLLLRRGIATFAFDGPGQGECFPEHPFVPDWERSTSAVLDHLEQDDALDSDRFAVLGRSLGGYLAVRSASQDHRLRACVAFGALFDMDFFEQMASVTQEGFRHITGIADRQAAQRAITEWIDLSDVIDRLQAPLYVLHGEADPLIPVNQAYRLEAAAVNARTTLVVEPGGDHCAHNRYHRVRADMADWLALQLKSQVA